MSNKKPSKCIYCKKPFDISSKCDHRDTKCTECRRIWQKLRGKYKWYGDGVDTHKLVRWYINQPQKCNWCGDINNLTIDRIKPQSQGGMYDMDNIQILCYKCNCLLKRGYSTMEEAMKPPTHKTCRICSVTKPINEYHRTGWKSKYMSIGKASYHGTCKVCRLKIESKKWAESHPNPKNVWRIKHPENY